MLFDSSFFQRHQKRLLRIANSRVLRWILGLNRLPKHCKNWKITKITPNAIHRALPEKEILKMNRRARRDYRFNRREFHQMAFFTRNRFGEALAYNLSPFAYLQTRSMRDWKWRFSPVGAFGAVAFALLFSKEKGVGFFLPFFATTDTFNPVAGENSPVDGWVRRRPPSRVSWADLHDGAGTAVGISDTSIYANVAFIRYPHKSEYYIDRGIFCFDTSTIADGATITSATIGLAGSYRETSGTNNFYVNIYAATPASTSTIAAADYGNFGTTAFSNKIAFAAWHTDKTYETFALNAAGIANISLTGVSKFGTRESDFDAANIAPSGTNESQQVCACNADYTGTDYDPYLSVTYSSATTVTSTVTAKARVKISGNDKTVTTKARIKNTVSGTVTAKARVKNFATKTLTSKARIKTSDNDKTVTAKAFISTAVSKTVTAKADIRKLSTTQSATVKGRIKRTMSISWSVKARIKRIEEKTILAKANIFNTVVRTIQSKADIKKMLEGIVDSKARINVINSKSIQAKARIKNTPDQSITSRARVMNSYTGTVTAKALIVNTVTKTVQAKARIKVIVSRTISSIARVKNTIVRTITARAKINSAHLGVTHGIRGYSGIQDGRRSNSNGVVYGKRSESEIQKGKRLTKNG